MDLYSTNMVGTTGPPRDVYDEILTAAGGFCPFCAGLGHVGSLDHYLPIFPPIQCIRATSSMLPRLQHRQERLFGPFTTQQTLHPYLDHDRFFNERWITALAFPGKSVLVQYSCTPPAAWSPNDKQRVESHSGSLRPEPNDRLWGAKLPGQRDVAR